MSVTERLRAFRYVTSARDIPWDHLRRVDVAAHRVREPDLHVMKNLVSLLADCNLFNATSPTVGLTEVHQLLSVLQLALQFTLWSQSVLKEQLVERQGSVTPQRSDAQYVERLEKKVLESSQEVIRLREERDNFYIASQAHEHRLAQAESTIRRLEKNLALERRRAQEVMRAAPTQKKHEQQQRSAVSPPFSPLSSSLSPPMIFKRRVRGMRPGERNEDCARHRCRTFEGRPPRDGLPQGGVSSDNLLLLHDDETTVGRTGRCVENFRTLLAEEEARALQSAKRSFAQWRADAQMALESQLATTIKRLKSGFVSQEKYSLDALTTPAFASVVSEERTCQRCRQRLLAAAPGAHGAECVSRLMTCETCGQAIAARLLKEHKGAAVDHNAAVTLGKTNAPQASLQVPQGKQEERLMSLEENREVIEAQAFL